MTDRCPTTSNPDALDTWIGKQAGKRLTPELPAGYTTVPMLHLEMSRVWILLPIHPMLTAKPILGEEGSRSL